MYIFIILTIFQLCATVFLIWVIGFFGSNTRKFGYTNFSDIEQNGILGYNLVYRILAPSVYITFLAVLLHSIHITLLLTNIWFIAVWYVILSFFISVTFGKFALVNKGYYFFTQILAVTVAYLLYVVSLNKGLEFILPDSSNFRTELWVIFIIFFYTVITNYQQDSEKYYEKKKRYVKSRYNFFHKKYQHLLEEQFSKNVFLENLLFSIMILEDLNRNKIMRFFERNFHFLGFVKTTGIMQVSSSQKLTDEESIKFAQNKIGQSYQENKDKYDNNHSLAMKIAEEYNPSGKYVSSVMNILGELIGNEFLFSTKKDKQHDLNNYNSQGTKEYVDILRILDKMQNLIKEYVDLEKTSFKKSEDIINNKNDKQ